MWIRQHNPPGVRHNKNTPTGTETRLGLRRRAAGLAAISLIFWNSVQSNYTNVLVLLINAFCHLRIMKSHFPSCAVHDWRLSLLLGVYCSVYDIALWCIYVNMFNRLLCCYQTSSSLFLACFINFTKILIWMGLLFSVLPCRNGLAAVA